MREAKEEGGGRQGDFGSNPGNGGGLDQSGKGNLDSGNILNIEPRETRDNRGKRRGEEFSGAKGSEVVHETWERPDNGEDEAFEIMAIYRI